MYPTTVMTPVSVTIAAAACFRSCQARHDSGSVTLHRPSSGKSRVDALLQRQGRGGRTHLVSPAMAAAAAITGHFVDIRDWKMEG